MAAGAASLLWQQAAANVGQGAMGILMQRLGAKYDRRQQLETQKQMMGLQMQGQKEMIDYEKMKDLEMWNATGWEAQRKQMEAAGMNPALAYGMGGGGGQTIGGSAPGISGGQAGYVNTMPQMMGIDIAETKLKLAQANLAQTQADKLAGVDTEKTKAETLNLTQDVQNKKASQTLTEVQTDIANIDKYIKGKTKDDVIETIGWMAQKAVNEVEMLWRQNLLNKAQYQDKIDMLKQELIGQMLRNTLTEAETTNVKKDTLLKDTQIALGQKTIEKITTEIQNLISQRMQSWRYMTNEERKVDLQRELGLMGIDIESQGQLIDGIKTIIGLGLFTGGGQSSTTPVRGFHNR